LANRRAKAIAWLEEKENKKKKNEEEIMIKKEVVAWNKELAKLVKKEGPKKLLSHAGISPSASSMPSTTTFLVFQVPLFAPPYLYKLCIQFHTFSWMM